MELYGFSSNCGAEPTIRFSANIAYAFYKASRDIEDFTVYFEDFLKELELLYNNKIEFAQFVPLERQLEIYLKQLDYGHIEVTIKLNLFAFNDGMYDSTLKVQYAIDQTFLPELIREISEVLADVNLE